MLVEFLTRYKGQTLHVQAEGKIYNFDKGEPYGSHEERQETVIDYMEVLDDNGDIVELSEDEEEVLREIAIEAMVESNAT